jgi:hypothetical protein
MLPDAVGDHVQIGSRENRKKSPVDYAPDKVIVVHLRVTVLSRALSRTFAPPDIGHAVAGALPSL